jgi:hypothetical protein
MAFAERPGLRSTDTIRLAQLSSGSVHALTVTVSVGYFQKAVVKICRCPSMWAV